MENSKEIIQSNIAGLNPTGIINFTGTYKMNGNNNIVLNSQDMSKNNLKKVQNNQVVCNSIENFENNINYNKNYIYLTIIILILGIILYYILYKKKS